MSAHEPPNCTCPKGRPLSMGHLVDCPAGEPEPTNVVALVQNPDTGRTIAVPVDVVYEAEREYRAYTSYAQGKSWKEVADDEGYPSAQAAQQAVKRYLDEGKAVIGDLTRTEMLAIEISELRGLRSALQPMVEEAKVPAIMARLGIHDRIMKALQLDVPDEVDAVEGGRTVVVPSETYLETLKIAASGGNAAG